MNRDNISALVLTMTVVVSVIIGLTIYFNNPSLKQAWSVEQQKDKGMVVGGVHSPEFQFEKNFTKLRSDAQSGITHPAIAGMVENQTMTTIKVNALQ